MVRNIPKLFGQYGQETRSAETKRSFTKMTKKFMMLPLCKYRIKLKTVAFLFTKVVQLYLPNKEKISV